MAKFNRDEACKKRKYFLKFHDDFFKLRDAIDKEFECVIQCGERIYPLPPNDELIKQIDDFINNLNEVKNNLSF